VRYDNTSRSVLADVEGRKGCRDRYFWINTVSLFSQKGLELRIFPYLQTVEGVKAVLDFTKVVLMNYWTKPSTQRRAKLIEKYYAELSDYQLNLKKLNEYEKILLNALNINGRTKQLQSSDSIEFLMDLHAKKPTAFVGERLAF
jgi:Tfp pilus assembly protein PilN